MSPQPKDVVRWPDDEGHMESAVSVRPCLKTHEIQTEVHHESNNSLNVCPVVEDEMDEEIMDDTEEQSEASRAGRVGQKKTVTPTLGEREEHERTHILDRSWRRHCVAARARQSCSSRPKVHTGRSEMIRHETSELRLLFLARSARNGISKDPGVERSRYSHGVCSCGATESSDSAMCSRFGTIGTLWAGHFEVRSGTSNRGRLEGHRETSWVSWNVVRAFAGRRFTVERVH